jgi:hypothetical protein
MTLFKTDIEALIYIIIICLIFIFVNNIINFILKPIKKLPVKYKISISFVFRIVSILMVTYFIIEGFPSFKQLSPEYQAILTGSISTAIAFASSGIFTNFISGIILIIIRPFDVGDLVKIKGNKGIVRSINLTRVVIETFDYILIEVSNSEVISSPIINYTIKLGRFKNFIEFKNKVQSPLDKGLFETNSESFHNKNEYENELKEVYESLPKKATSTLYSYTFRMAFPYKGFRIIMDKVDKLSEQYKNKGIFRLKPRFHIVDFGFNIIVKFRLLTFNSDKIFEYQSQFAKDVYKIIYEQKGN